MAYFKSSFSIIVLGISKRTQFFIILFLFDAYFIVLTIQILFFFQVWFQNRRAKFRRNERSLSIQNSPNSKLSAKPPSPVGIPLKPDGLNHDKGFPYQNSPGHPSDLQYMMPWKCASYSQYNPTENIYSNNLNSTLFSSNAFNYSSNVCNRLDMSSFRYRQEFNLQFYL